MQRIDKEVLENVDAHSLPDVLSVSIWVLEYLSNDSKEEFGASEVANYMIDELGISTSRQSVHAALKKATAKNFCHKNKGGFKIMKLGQEELLKLNQQERVVFIEPGLPFKAGVKVEALFNDCKGVIKISDPYVDIKTLGVIDRCIDPAHKIKLLTSQISKEPNFKREVQKMVIEGFDIEVRRLTAGVLHDRYFIDDKSFWLSGNSLNNLGKKESFIAQLGEDVRRGMVKTFDSRWQSATVV